MSYFGFGGRKGAKLGPQLYSLSFECLLLTTGDQHLYLGVDDMVFDESPTPAASWKVSNYHKSDTHCLQIPAFHSTLKSDR